MLFEYEEASAFNTSGAHHKFPKPPAPFQSVGRGGRRLPPLCAPLALKAFASVYVRSIGHAFF
jgi:hypothetical protein